MSLAEGLAQTVEAVRSAVPTPIFAAIGQSIADLKATGQDARAAGIGTTIDLPVLSDLHAQPLDLKVIVAGRPVLLHLLSRRVVPLLQCDAAGLRKDRCGCAGSGRNHRSHYA